MRPPTTARRGFLAVALAAFATLGLTAGTSDAGYKTVKIFYEFSGSGTPQGSSSSPFVEYRFEDMTFESVKSTKVTVNTTHLSLLGTNAYVSNLYFNVATAGESWTKTNNVKNITGGFFDVTDFNYSLNTYKADGDGKFDFKIDLPTPESSRFGVGDSLSFILKNFDYEWSKSLSVDGPVGKNGFVAAAHIQGIGAGGTGSGWYTGSLYEDDGSIWGPSGIAEVPAPPAVVLAVMGVGLFGFVGRRLRRPATA